MLTGAPVGELRPVGGALRAVTVSMVTMGAWYVYVATQIDVSNTLGIVVAGAGTASTTVYLAYAVMYVSRSRIVFAPDSITCVDWLGRQWRIPRTAEVLIMSRRRRWIDVLALEFPDDNVKLELSVPTWNLNDEERLAMLRYGLTQAQES